MAESSNEACAPALGTASKPASQTIRSRILACAVKVRDQGLTSCVARVPRSPIERRTEVRPTRVTAEHGAQPSSNARKAIDHSRQLGLDGAGIIGQQSEP
jgi:hypothetical protein